MAEGRFGSQNGDVRCRAYSIPKRFILNNFLYTILKTITNVLEYLGIIEMVCDAETLRAIQVEWGLTGSFKDKPIAEWLAKHNPSELEYERAVTNFTG